jgi:hypothetical protein
MGRACWILPLLSGCLWGAWDGELEGESEEEGGGGTNKLSGGVAVGWTTDWVVEGRSYCKGERI